MDISPSHNRQEIPTAGSPPGESSSGQSSGCLVGSRRVTSPFSTPESDQETTETAAMASPCRCSPRKHPRSEQEVELATYDSDDGQCDGPIEKEGVQDFDEDEEIAIGAPAATAAIQETTAQSVIGEFISIEDSAINKMKVNELKQALFIRGIRKKVGSGRPRKADLRARLRQALEEDQSRCAKLPLRKSPRINVEEDVVVDDHNAPRFTDSSLAMDGSLSMRLRTDLKHRPARERKRKSKCQLHRWASGLHYRAAILWCQDCHVHLCVDCFNTFHDDEDLVKSKVKLGSLFQEQQNKKQAKRKACKSLAAATQTAEA